MPDKTNQESAATGEGAWIFLSHSNKDFEQVREIRNELEKRGHKPIMFYLKCLENDNALLPDLLRREIAAREWFILCDSPNAQASRYVRDEVELIKSMEGKAFEVMDLSKGLQTELHKLIRISKRATVFLSYAYVQQDHEFAEKIRRALVKHDYRVWSDSAMMPGQDFAATIHAAIDDAVRHGFVLVLLSRNSLTNPNCKHETEYALQLAAQTQRSNVVPVIISPFERGAMPLQLAKIQWFDLASGPFEERVEELIRNLKTREME